MKKLILETERLLLRPFEVEDAPFFLELNSDPEVIKYTGDQAFKDLEAAQEFLRGYDQYQRYGTGRMSVFLKSTGAYLGWSGLKYQAEIGETDLGYRFFRHHWGQGYATESGQVSLAYGFEHLGLERIVARTMADNQASVKVIEKLGMQFVDQINFIEHPGLLYAITREEWTQQRDGLNSANNFSIFGKPK